MTNASKSPEVGDISISRHRRRSRRSLNDAQHHARRRRRRRPFGVFRREFVGLESVACSTLASKIWAARGQSDGLPYGRTIHRIPSLRLSLLPLPLTQPSLPIRARFQQSVTSQKDLTLGLSRTLGRRRGTLGGRRRRIGRRTGGAPASLEA